MDLEARVWSPGPTQLPNSSVGGSGQKPYQPCSLKEGILSSFIWYGIGPHLATANKSPPSQTDVSSHGYGFYGLIVARTWTASVLTP